MSVGFQIASSCCTQVPSPSYSKPIASLTLPPSSDIAVVGLGFHRFDDPNLAARRLAARLRPGGILLILDFLPHGENMIRHGAEHTVTHHGFSEESIRAIFEQAGVTAEYGLEVAGGIIFPMGERRVFLARGCKL